MKGPPAMKERLQTLQAQAESMPAVTGMHVAPVTDTQVQVTILYAPQVPEPKDIQDHVINRTLALFREAGIEPLDMHWARGVAEEAMICLVNLPPREEQPGSAEPAETAEDPENA